MFVRRILVVTLLCVCGLAHADADLQQFLEQTVRGQLASSGVPAMAVMVQRDGKLEAQVAAGLRATGHPQPVTLKDEWHLGSCTKAMTATLVARLVEQGYLSFDDTVARIFPGVAARMHRDLHGVTVMQLLTHTSGLEPLTSPQELSSFMRAIKSAQGVRAQRAAVAVHYLAKAPASAAGEFVYSNLGYVIVGAIVEERTGRTWEDLILGEVWKPLGIRDAGFGPPGHSGRFDQPQGHEWRNDVLTALDPGDTDSDNPPVIGPAGTVHMRLADWMRFAQDQLDGEHGKGKLLTAESYRRLHSAVGRNYAMGWGTLRAADGSLDVLTHAGSNGYWLADVRIFPKRNLIFLTAMNAGGDRALVVDRALNKALTDRLKALE
jgi:CubicO group peptidase (beta-lactamase class C family)